MRKLFTFLARPVVWSTVALVLLLLALHVVCPLLDVADGQRWVIELLVGIPLSVLLLGYHVRQLLLDRRVAKALPSQVQPPAAMPGPDALRDWKELSDELTRGVSELNQVCRERKQIGGISALPWVLILGANGAGKSTALARSGLRFVNHDNRRPGSAGSRSCTWWLASDAVILDTPGRYADKDEDRKEWRAFLQLLRKQKRRPLDAVLLQVGIDELVDRSRAEVELLAFQLRERLDDLLVCLDAQVPVHLLVNKCDLIDGFVPFFAGLDETEKAGPWGFRIDSEALKQTTLGETFQQHFLALLRHLGQRATMRVLSVAERQQKEATLQFPQELEAMASTLRYFVETLFEARARSQSPWLCAIHLGSAEQSGQLLRSQRLKRAEELGLPSARAVPSQGAVPSESCFVRGVFAQVIRQAALSARPSQAHQKRLGVQQKLAVAAAGVACLLGSMLLGGRYSHAVLWLAQLEDVSTKLAHDKRSFDIANRTPKQEFIRELQAQESVRTLLDEEPRGVPHQPGMLAAQLLRKRIESSWLVPLAPQLVSDLERAAHHQGGTPDEAVARGFHVLRLLYVVSGNACAGTDPETTRDSLSQVIVEHWLRALGGQNGVLRPSADRDDEQRPQTPYLQLRRELEFYFHQSASELKSASQLRLLVDESLREQAKQSLSRDSDGAGCAELVFTLRASLANLYERDKQLPSTSVLADSGIQRVYTQDGCKQFFSKESTQGSEWWSCVVGKDLPKSPPGLDEVYRQNYTAAWNAWQQEITFAKATPPSAQMNKVNLKDMIGKLDAMFRSGPPALVEVLGLFGRGQKQQIHKGARRQRDASFFAGCGKTVNHAVEKTKVTWETVKLPQACQIAQEDLQPLTQLASQAKPQENPDSAEGSILTDYKAYQEAARALRNELSRLSNSTERSADSLKLVQDTMAGKGVLFALRVARETLLQDANGQLRQKGISLEDSRGLAQVLQELEHEAWLSLLPSAAKALQDKWHKEVSQEWQTLQRGLLPTDADEDKCKKKTEFLRATLKPFVEKSLAVLFEGDYLPDCHPKRMGPPFQDVLPLSLEACAMIRTALKVGQELNDCSKAMGGGGGAPKRDLQQVDVSKPQVATKLGCTTEADMVWLDRTDKVFECSVSTGVCRESKTQKSSQRARLIVKWKGLVEPTVVLENDYAEPFFRHARTEQGKLVFDVPEKKAPGQCRGYRVLFGLAPAPAGGGSAVPQTADTRWKSVSLPDSIVGPSRKDN